MPKAFTETEFKNFRENLLKTGEKIFLEKGLKKAGIVELTSTVGIALGSFYKFFPSKEELLLELLDIYNNETFDLLKSILNRQMEENKLDMEEIILATFESYRKKPVYMMLFENNEEYEFLMKNISRKKIKDNLHKDREVMEYIVRSAKKHWNLEHEINEDIVAGMLQYIFLGLVNRDIIGNNVVDMVLKKNVEITARYIETGEL